MCDNQIDRPIPLDSTIYAVVNKNDLCVTGCRSEHHVRALGIAMEGSEKELKACRLEPLI